MILLHVILFKHSLKKHLRRVQIDSVYTQTKQVYKQLKYYTYCDNVGQDSMDNLASTLMPSYTPGLCNSSNCTLGPLREEDSITEHQVQLSPTQQLNSLQNK